MLGGFRSQRLFRSKRVITVTFLILIFVVLEYKHGAKMLQIYTGYQTLTTWIEEPMGLNKLHDKKCLHHNASFWKLPVSSKFSYDPEVCQMISTEDQFQLNLQNIFQEKHFENVTCNPRTALAWREPHILTALASYPGSGNTWSRHLIEQLTGIQTSSVYCDATLRRQFVGECMKKKELSIAVKTHYGPQGKKYAFRKTVLIIRNPFDTLVAFYQFRKRGHTGVVSEMDFNREGAYFEAWRAGASKTTRAWTNFNLSWMKQFNYSLHPLLFENLLHQETFFYELFKLSQFLNVPVTYETLWCVWVNREGKFHRKSKKDAPKSIVRYDSVLTKKVKEAIIEVNDAFAGKFGFHLPFLKTAITS